VVFGVSRWRIKCNISVSICQKEDSIVNFKNEIRTSEMWMKILSTSSALRRKWSLGNEHRASKKIFEDLLLLLLFIEGLESVFALELTLVVLVSMEVLDDRNNWVESRIMKSFITSSCRSALSELWGILFKCEMRKIKYQVKNTKKQCT
jgi:hypothetical protein